MSDLTQHQRDILVAMLQNKRIEHLHDLPAPHWVEDEDGDTLDMLTRFSERIRVAPNQCEAVRLYGWVDDSSAFFNGANGLPNNNHYIDISPNGFIVGGKIEEAK